MYDFSVKIADRSFAFSIKYRLLYDMCSKYLTEGGEDEIKLSVSEEEMAEQMPLFEEDTAPDVCEAVCMHRKVAEELALHGAAAFHGAAITYNGKAYLFTGPSGVGKSTHIKLWKKYIGSGVGIINGDKPIIAEKNGSLYVYSSPWAGKEMWQKNTSAPLGAICIIEKSPVCSIRSAGNEELLSRLIKQIYLPKSAEGVKNTFKIYEDIVKNVPVFVLGCDISENAAAMAFETMTGEKYGK